MDPITAIANATTAIANAIAAQIHFAHDVFKAAPEANKTAVAAAQTAVLENILEFARRSQERMERIGDAIDKVFHRDKPDQSAK
jgi:hypothetical protein